MDKSEPPKKRIKSLIARLKNVAKTNYRGLLGVLPALAILSWQSEKGVHSKTVELMWMLMFWFLLWQPVAVSTVGLIPIFLLPMSGAMSTTLTCGCYMNENVVLYIITGYLILLLNNSGVDRRIALWFICSGDPSQYSAKRIILKVSSAAFFLSMLSSRLITASTLTQYVTPALMKMKATTLKDSGPDFDEMRYIINNAIQTSSGIGSTAIMHSSYVTVLFRAIFDESTPLNKEYPDIFNYLQYSAFAFPVAFIMFILNCVYHMLLVHWVIKKPMDAENMAELQNHFLKLQLDIPRRISLHEKLSVIFLAVILLVFFFRWNIWLSGWAEFNIEASHPLIPKVKDATVGAIFLIILHVIPKGYGFLKFIGAKTKSQLPPLKPESSVLWWRFVDKNINYGYFFIFGGAIALMNAGRETGLCKIISENSGKVFTEKPWNAGIFLVVFITTILANVMSALAACGMFLPYVMCMSMGAPLPWPNNAYLAAMGTGIASSFGFCIPFQYTPAYFCHYTGKVPIKKMIKYSFISVWICLITLWVALLVWGPFLFDPEDLGIFAVDAPPPPAATTTPVPDDGEGGGRI